MSEIELYYIAIVKNKILMVFGIVTERLINGTELKTQKYTHIPMDT